MCQAWDGDGQGPTPWTVLKARRTAVHMEEDSPCLRAAAASLRPWRWCRESHLPRMMVLALAPGPCTFEPGMSNSPSVETTWLIRLQASVGHYLAAWAHLPLRVGRPDPTSCCMGKMFWVGKIQENWWIFCNHCTVFTKHYIIKV